MKLSLVQLFLIINLVLDSRNGSSIRVDVNNNQHPLIIGGTEAELGEFPYQALLYTTRVEHGKPNRYLCGGSLLNSRWVLTAGHCITGATKIEVVLGITDRLKYGITGVSQWAKKWILHEKYQPFSLHSTLTNDIALVLLSKDVREGNFIKYISLATDPKKNYVGKIGIISGWGKTYDFQSSGTQYLQHAVVKIIRNSKCSRAYPLLKASTFCVVSTDSHKVEAPCNGDSGGPLIVDEKGKKKLVGIVSYGKKNACEKGYPAVFTRVASYAKNWILPKMKSHSESDEDKSSEEENDVRDLNNDDDLPHDLKENNFPIVRRIPTDLTTTIHYNFPIHYYQRELKPKVNYIIKYKISVMPGDYLKIKYVI